MADQVEYEVIDMQGKKLGKAELSPVVFNSVQYKDAVHATVRWQLAKRRQGTHSTLTRSEMNASGAKPFKQKGTGNARAGSRVSPLWRGGAVIHGPKPRSYEYSLPKNIRKNALRTVLSEKVRANKLVVVDSIDVPSGKTKDMQAVLNAIGVSKSKVLLVTAEKQENMQRSGRNLAAAKILTVAGANVYDILNSEFLVLTKDSIKALEERLQ